MGPQVTSAFLILHSPSENPEALSSRHIDLDFDLDFDFDLIIEILVSCPKYIYVFGQCNNRPIAYNAYIFKYKYRCDNKNL